MTRTGSARTQGESIFFCLVCCIWFWQDAADNAGALPRGPQRTPIYIFCLLSPFQCAFKYTYLFLVLAVLGLHCCTRAFSSCHEWGLLSSCSVQASRAWASVVAVCGLSCSVACGSSLTRDQTCVLCIGRQILNHWTTREVPISVLLMPNPQLFFRRWPSDSPVALLAKVGSCYTGHRELILVLCDNLEGWDGVGVRFRRERNICVLVADSHCCMEEDSPYCKAIIFQLYIKKESKDKI